MASTSLHGWKASAQPGGICISDDAYRQVRGNLDVIFQNLGEQELKNIARPVRVYQLRPDALASMGKASASGLALPDKPSIAVLRVPEHEW